MKLKKIFNNYNLFALFLYLTLIIGFLFGENLNYGSYYDWTHAYEKLVQDFSSNFINTLLSYDQYGQRHSPIYLIFLSIFLDLGFSLGQIRFIHLHLSIPLIIIFYKCLELKFEKVDPKYIFLLSLSIFLSPTFRSLSIWPDSRLPGLLFFILAIYFFLKFQKNNDVKYIWYNCISLLVSSYISPNFSLFYLYFFFHYFKQINIFKLLPLIFLIFAASLPSLYYIFVLKINFLISGQTPGDINESVSLDFNLSNKIMIISSIILFHLSPVLLANSFYKKILHSTKKNIFYIFPLFIILVYLFDYEVFYTGGGFFFQMSNYIFNNNYLFFIFCFLSISLIFYLSRLNLNNFLLILFLILSNIQNSIYHKYYEPMVIIIFFTLFKGVESETFFKNKINLFYIYFFSLFFILTRILKNII